MFWHDIVCMELLYCVANFEVVWTWNKVAVVENAKKWRLYLTFPCTFLLPVYILVFFHVFVCSMLLRCMLKFSAWRVGVKSLHNYWVDKIICIFAVQNAPPFKMHHVLSRRAPASETYFPFFRQKCHAKVFSQRSSVLLLLRNVVLDSDHFFISLFSLEVKLLWHNAFACGKCWSR